jgi:anaerobic sulfite reductase subunit C
VEACREDAVTVDMSTRRPAIDAQRCVACGGCMAACPTGTIETGASGYRIQLGGKLGRHPQLSSELPGIYAAAQVIGVVKDCLSLYKTRSKEGPAVWSASHRGGLGPAA